MASRITNENLFDSLATWEGMDAPTIQARPFSDLVIAIAVFSDLEDRDIETDNRLAAVIQKIGNEIDRRLPVN